MTSAPFPPWQMPPRSEAAQALYAQAAAEREARPQGFALDPDALTDELDRRAKKNSHGPIDLSEGLQLLAQSARQEGNLNALGERAMRRTILALAGRAPALKRFAAQDSSIAYRWIDRPIIIVGGWRTGSTLLHRLLASVPGLRAPRFWELANPITAITTDAAERARLIASAQAIFDLQYTLNPTKQLVHAAGAELPEECSVAMGGTGRNWALTAMAHMPSYSAWLRDQDFTGEYELHKLSLQILQGEQAQTRWLLKAPVHLPELGALLSVFNDATVIFLQRDIVDIVASAANLFSVFHATYSDAVDAEAVGAYQLDTLKYWYEKSAAVPRNGFTNHDTQYGMLNYEDLIKAPVDSALSILEACGIPRAARIEQAMQSFIDIERKTPHGRVSYSPEQFGLSPEVIREAFKGLL